MVKGSTITGNTASKGISAIGAHGGLYNDTARAQLNNSTIASNTAEVQGAGIANGFGDVVLNNVTATKTTPLAKASASPTTTAEPTQ
jgi:hypothetical protein